MKHDEFLSRQLAIFEDEVSKLLEEIMNNCMGYGDINKAKEKVPFHSNLPTIS